MSDVFPQWANRLPRLVLVGAVLVSSALVSGSWYYLTPKYSRVGYQPVQPTAFSHAVHVEQMGMDCRYCHSAVERSWYSNIPAATTCMNCHDQVLKGDPRLALVRESAATGQTIPWVRVHRVPDFVYFNHAVHVTRGIGCFECHGPLNTMDEIYHAQPLTMTFCLDCHRNPAAKIRPLEEVYNLTWQRPTNFTEAQGRRFVQDWNVRQLEWCSTCHR